jgi:proline iminopeptidase
MQNGEYFLELNGVRHWVRIAGAEHATIPLIVVHGGPGGIVYTFEQTAGAHLEKYRTVVYYEQRGCGRSSPSSDSRTYTIPWLTRDLEALCRELGLHRVHVLGFSFGAELALEYAHAPASIFGSRIVAVQLNGFEQIVSPELRQRIRELQSMFDPRQALERIWEMVDNDVVDRFLFRDSAAAKRNRQTWVEFNRRFNPCTEMAQAFKFTARDPDRAFDVLPKVQAPTLVVTGLFDRNGGVDLNRDAASLIPNSRFRIFEQSAHFPDIEETERYVEEIMEFLKP